MGEKKKNRESVDKVAKRVLDHERMKGNTNYTYEKARDWVANIARRADRGDKSGGREE